MFLHGLNDQSRLLVIQFGPYDHQLGKLRTRCRDCLAEFCSIKCILRVDLELRKGFEWGTRQGDSIRWLVFHLMEVERKRLDMWT